MSAILVLTTGGTIDKEYGAGVGVRDLHIGAPIASDFLHKMIPTDDTVVILQHELFRKDSLDITDEDRAEIASTCSGNAWSCRKFIITHGTDTMVKTAKAISREAVQERTIVITGALRPAVMRESDAEFNLGLALSACLYAPPGIYIAMNGVHEWDKCKKNPTTGLFEYSRAA